MTASYGEIQTKLFRASQAFMQLLPAFSGATKYQLTSIAIPESPTRDLWS
jgi:hypothetical protein